MAYTTIDKPSDYFDTKVYTGTQSNNITLTMDNVGWVWMKNRTNSGNNILMDVVRGGNNSNSQKPVLVSNTGGAEQGSDITATGGVAFGSTSTVIGSDNGGYNYNNSTSSSYVAWHWGTGTSFTNDASSTSIGTIDSAGSASDDSGFSIVSYTGTGSAGTIKHGLNSVPSMMIIKRRDATADWIVYHDKNTAAPETDYLILSSTAATADYADHFNDTAPTSSLFTVGSDAGVNASSGTFIAYCFAEKQGYSKFGSYKGNGNADGTFVYTGFKPAFFLVKRSDSTTSWTLLDNKRDPFNVTTERLFPNENVAGSVGTNANTDFLSNGVKIRVNHNNFNTSGGTYIYMAFAENPFVTSTGVPATAR